MTRTYRLAPPVRRTLIFAAVVFAVLGVTLPLAIWFLIAVRAAHVTFDDDGLVVRGLGPSVRWNFREITRLGTLTVEVVGGGPLVALNGGAVAVNLVAQTRSRRTLKFLLSRFEGWEAILDRVQRATGLPLESVTPGIVGPSWPRLEGTH